MQTQPATRNIDGHEYTISMLPASQALKAFKLFGKTLAPALAEIGASLDLKQLEKDPLDAFKLERLPRLASTLFDSASFEEWNELAKLLLSGALVNGAPLDRTYEQHFAGKVMTLLKVVLFAAEVNFADFLGGLDGLRAFAVRFLGQRLARSGALTPKSGSSGDPSTPA